jgi:cyclohexa-1,5-dienecarbonyl-CoA hydratase
MTAPTVRLEREGGLGRLVLDRPPVNVLDIATMEAANRCLQSAAEDPSIRVLTVTGAGPAFSAGVDVADHTEERVESMLNTFHQMVGRIMSLEVPVIAIVHGAALGGGCELALACDIVLARADARLGQPEITLAVFPPVAAALLPRLVGRQRALDLILSGRTFSGEDAARLGLAAHAWPADDFSPRADAYVNALLQLSGPALRLAKRAVDQGLDLPFAEALSRAERVYRRDLMALDDAREGLASFLEKRSPVWKEA